MSDTKVLQAILDGQVAIREGLGRLEKKVDDGFKKLGDRIDKLGLHLANLEDDAPTADEFNRLEKRVSKLEKHAISI